MNAVMGDFEKDFSHSVTDKGMGIIFKQGRFLTTEIQGNEEI
jgi:hypothetical protein